LITEVLWFVDVLTSFWGQRSRSQQWPKRPCEHYIWQTNKGNFTQFWSQIYLGS